MKHILILMTCFFHYDYIERTIKSIENSKGEFNYDIFLLENPSKYSDKIAELKTRHRIKKHFMSDTNLAGQINVVFLKNINRNQIAKYDYIAITEADAKLDPKSINEAINILTTYTNIKLCSINVHLNLPKYKPVAKKIRGFIPHAVAKKDYVIGPTGFQFIIFKRHFLFKFVDAILAGKLKSKIALGIGGFTGMSDTNLKLFCQLSGVDWVRTKTHKLDHIGWEPLIKKTPLSNEYREIKMGNVGKTIRINIDYNKYKLNELV